MQEPASFYYGVMWNKLYRADIVREHPDVRCNEELDYSEDLYFNLALSATPSSSMRFPPPFTTMCKTQTAPCTT